MRTIRHREVKWHDQDHNTNNRQRQSPDGSLAAGCALSTPTVLRRKTRRHSGEGGPKIKRKTLTPNPKVGTGKYVYLCFLKIKFSANPFFFL